MASKPKPTAGLFTVDLSALNLKPSQRADMEKAINAAVIAELGKIHHITDLVLKRPGGSTIGILADLDKVAATKAVKTIKTTTKTRG